MDEKKVAKRMKAVKDALEERNRGIQEANELFYRAHEMLEECRIQFLERLKKMGARSVDVTGKGVAVNFDDGHSVKAGESLGEKFTYRQPL